MKREPHLELAKSDVAGLAARVPFDPLQYQEIQRTQTALRAAQRWPLLAQVRSGGRKPSREWRR